MKPSPDPVEDTYGKDLPWRKVLRFATRAVLRHPLILTAVILAAFGVVGAELVSLGLLMPFIDTLRGGGSGDIPLGFLMPFFEGMSAAEKVRAIAIGLVLVSVIRGVFSYIQSRVSSYMKIVVERDLRQDIFDDLLRVDVGFLNRERTGNLYTILQSYPRRAAKLVDQYLGSLSKGITFVAYVVMLVAVSWQLTLIAIGLGILSILAVGQFRVWIKRFGRRINKSRVQLNQTSLESLQAMKVIRLFAREEHARKRFLDEVKNLQNLSFKQASISAAVAPVHRTVNLTLFAVLLILATFILADGTSDWLMLLTVFLLVMTRLMGPMGSFTRRQTKIASTMPALEAIIDYLERDDKTYLPDGDRAFGRLQEGVRFDHVSFAYGGGPRVVRDVTFDVPRGKTVAIVGASGSGKSTLVNLLTRLSDPVEGRILVDGEDLRTFQVGTWRRRVAVVSQATFLFNDTIRENIRFGRIDATDEEVEAAARTALAHEFILEMEDGYETFVGDQGVRLSGGQAQRIAIARALLVDPDILVLDEATSALDAQTERYVQEAVDRVSRDRTVVAIAHRLSTIRKSDEILVLEEGRIVERGTHDDLLSRGGRYARYVHMQDLQGGDEAADPTPVDGDAPRVVLTPGEGTARVIHGDAAHERVPVHHLAASNGRAATHGDGIYLRPGADTALVRWAGREHPSAPLYARMGRNGDAKEIRIRVRALKDRATEPARP